MGTTREKFIDACMDIVTAKPEYKRGCSGLKQCDCIGMVKYGLMKNGVYLSTTGTNWTIRNQVTNIRQITGKAVLKAGDVVFKRKAQGDDGYDLPPKYREGGSAYNGDLNDYCHIGVVKSVNPLRIIHMTGPTAKTDTSIGKWKIAADLKPQYISDSNPTAQESDEDPEPVTMTATVSCDNGKPLNFRTQPSTTAALLDRIPINTVVTVKTYKSDWCQIIYRRNTGYVMTRFLSFG